MENPPDRKVVHPEFSQNLLLFETGGEYVLHSVLILPIAMRFRLAIYAL
jgi:hypothetical protein